MTYTKRRNGSFKPSYDRGDGWKVTKDEWQDFEKAQDAIVTVQELKDYPCPGSTSTITIPLDHIKEGLKFELHVGLKEYRPSTWGDRKYDYRKPTTLHSNVVGAIGIPIPGIAPHISNWCEKKSWSAAVRLVLDEIIPVYEQANLEALPLRTVVPEQDQ